MPCGSFTGGIKTGRLDGLTLKGNLCVGHGNFFGGASQGGILLGGALGAGIPTLNGTVGYTGSIYSFSN